MEQVRSTTIEPDRSQNLLSNTLKRIASAFATLVDMRAYKAEMARYERELRRKNGEAEER